MLYAILEQLPGNEPLRLTGVSRGLRALVLGCPVVHASLGVSCREGEGIVAKRCDSSPRIWAVQDVGSGSRVDRLSMTAGRQLPCRMSVVNPAA